MKIGILTFHWGTNYGAILQAYALQTHLEKQGHEALIIDYKPDGYNTTIFNILTSRRILRLKSNLKNSRKEKILSLFRLKYFNLTKHYNSINTLKKDPPICDVYISGSDQVMNPSFTLYGEGGPTSTYYLDFGNTNIRKIGYAVSFGCTTYPNEAKKIAQPLLSNFDFISVRERSGEKILSNMGYSKSCLVPDPTLLLSPKEYDNLIFEKTIQTKNYVYLYLLRDIRLIKKKLNTLKLNYKWSDSNGEYSISSWISNIKNSSAVITDSFHGMVFCLLYHIPFMVVLKSKMLVGMNDRFFTLLEELKLTDRIMEMSEINNLESKLYKNIEWTFVDKKLNKIKAIGESFLDSNIN